MIRHAVALRYAKALFRIDQKKHAHHKRMKDFECYFALSKKNPKLVQVLEAPFICQKEKEKILKTALEGRVDPIFLNFLFYITKKKRVHSLSEIFVEYCILVDSEEHVWEAELVSGASLQPLPRQDLIAKLEKFYDKKIVLKEQVEPKILGGTFLILGNKLIDWSIKTRIQKLESHLLGLDICR